MGAAADAAKGNSKFLKLSMNESCVMEFLGYEVVPSQKDPDKKVVRCKLRNTANDTKYWDTGNTNTMMIIDQLKPGQLVEIARKPWENPDKTIDPNKSSWWFQVARES